jgi:hypothetical protein
VDFGRRDRNQTIKSDVAPVTREMLDKYPKIRFYESLNPDNQKGVELACIGAVDLDAIIAYCAKFMRRIFAARFRTNKVRVLPQQTVFNGQENEKMRAA